MTNMKTKVIGKSVCVVVLIVFILTSCTTLVHIDTNVPANITINGQPAGKTPVQRELSDFILSTDEVVLTADGYITYRGRLRKEFKVGACVAGFFLFFPWAWAYGPDPYQYFILQES
jgi:hypothetical protein